MIDINLIRENPEKIKTALLKRMDNIDFQPLLELDKKRRQLITENDILKQERNKVNEQIPVLKKQGNDIADLMVKMKETSQSIKEKDKILLECEQEIKAILEVLPNIPAEDVMAGGKENNEVISITGKKPEFDFKIKDHVELVTNLRLIDYKRGVKLGGNGHWLYSGKGSLLEWGLLNYFVNEHIKDGYNLIMPPHLLLFECGYTAGQFPKFRDDVFHLKSDENNAKQKFILPTAETALVNLHRDEILSEDDLPVKLFSYTPCYRKEAGSYRAGERGMIRGHQFNKVEMFQYTLPESSEDALKELLEKAERLVKDLGLHYRVSKLAAGDCSASMGKTYDIEVWIPSMNEYKEISSISNGYDYQARRGNIRIKRKSGKKDFVHTLNASGLATSRLLRAIVEQFQNKDGSVNVPSVLQECVDTSVLRPM